MLLKDYRNYLKIERAMSPNTVASYCCDVEKFLDDVEVEDVREMTPAVILDYLSSCQGLSKRSQARLLSSLRSFFGWCIVEDMITDNPCDMVDSPKLGRYLPDVLLCVIRLSRKYDISPSRSLPFHILSAFPHS